MAQIRYYNYGMAMDNETEKFVNISLHQKGVYRGFDLSVDVNGDLVVAPGAALQFNGLVWEEDTEFVIGFNAPGPATDYTLIATHEDRTILGGVAVEYSLEEGLLTNSTLLNGIALGWIRHPGGGVPLVEAYITEAEKLAEGDHAQIAVNTAPVELVPPFTHYANSNIGIDITITPNEFDPANFVVAQKIENSPTAVPPTQTVIQNFMFFVRAGYRPINVVTYTEFATSATYLKLEVFDTALAPVPVTNGTIYGTGAWRFATTTIQRDVGTFTDGEPYTIRLTYSVDKGEYIRIGRLLLNTSPFI